MSSVGFFRGFEERKYDRFFLDAKAIAGSLKNSGAKLSWLPCMTPSYDNPHLFQGSLRWIKGWIGFTANGTQASEYALKWSFSLINCNSVPSEIDREKHVRCFLDAFCALKEQSRLYKAKNFVASKNYEEAANYVYDFTYKYFANEVSDITISRVRSILGNSFL